MAESLRLQHPQSLSEMVAERLRVAIIDGEFALGEAISEDKLATAFGVSRSPIRDALNALQFTGLVEVRSKRGSFVFFPTEDEVRELCEYRFILENEAAMMALRADPKELSIRLEAAINAMAGAEEADDRRAYGHADTAFHTCFFDLCGNELIRAAHRLAEARIATLRTMLTAPFDDRRASGLQQHRDMAAQLLAENLDGFAGMLKLHADWSGRLPQAIMRQGKRAGQ